MSFERGAWEKKTSKGIGHFDINGEGKGEIITRGYRADVEETHTGGISFCPYCGAMILNNQTCDCIYSIVQNETPKHNSDYLNKPKSDYEQDYSNKPTYKPKDVDKPKSNYNSKPRPNTNRWVTCPKCKEVYNKTRYYYCPNCRKTKRKSNSNSGSGWSRRLVLVIFILIILLMFGIYFALSII